MPSNPAPHDTTGSIDTIPSDTSTFVLPDTLTSNWLDSASAAAGGVALSAATRGDSVFVAVGGSGRILVSHDGSLWQVVTSGTSIDLHSVSGGLGGRPFLVLGQSNTLLYSTDGSQWTKVPIVMSESKAYSFSWRRMASNESTFVLVGLREYMAPGDVTYVALVSSDGVTWSWNMVTKQPGRRESAEFSLEWDVVAGVFVIQGRDRYTSTDGVEWK